MKNTQENASGPFKNSEEEIFRQHGLSVTDMAKRGIRAIGILRGVRRQDQGALNNYRDFKESNDLVPDLSRELVSRCFRSPEPKETTQNPFLRDGHTTAITLLQGAGAGVKMGGMFELGGEALGTCWET